MPVAQIDFVHCCNCFANRTDYGQATCTNCGSPDVNRQQVWECECGRLYDDEDTALGCCEEAAAEEVRDE